MILNLYWVEKKNCQKRNKYFQDQRTNRLIALERIDFVHNNKFQKRILLALKQETSHDSTTRIEGTLLTPYRLNTSEGSFEIDLDSLSAVDEVLKPLKRSLKSLFSSRMPVSIVWRLNTMGTEYQTWLQQQYYHLCFVLLLLPTLSRSQLTSWKCWN